MIKFDSLRVGLAMAASALVASCASFADPLTETLQPLGAWASGTDGDACETAPITYFSSDGVVLVLLSAKGPVHAIDLSPEMPRAIFGNALNAARLR